MVRTIREGPEHRGRGSGEGSRKLEKKTKMVHGSSHNWLGSRPPNVAGCPCSWLWGWLKQILQAGFLTDNEIGLGTACLLGTRVCDELSGSSPDKVSHMLCHWILAFR